MVPCGGSAAHLLRQPPLPGTQRSPFFRSATDFRPEPLPRHLQPAAGGLNLRYALWICHVRNSRYLPS